VISTQTWSLIIQLAKKAKWMSYDAPLVFIGKELRKIEYFFS